MPNISEVRFLVEHQGKFLRLFKLAFSRRDASIYLFPYAPTGKYYFGGRSMPDANFKDTFDYTSNHFAKNVPKLSIHESGQVHIVANEVRTEPLQIPPLDELSRQHIASVSVDRFHSLAEYQKKPNFSGSTVDRIIKTENEVNSGKIAIYVSSGKKVFETPVCNSYISLKRPSLDKMLYICLRAKSQDPLGDKDSKGITVIAGWDPTGIYQEGRDYYFIRGV